MKSVSYEKILAALESGKHLSKYDAADIVPCDQRTAQRMLAKIHKEGKIRICEWRTNYQHKIPVYSVDSVRDVKKPKPVPRLVYLKKYRDKHREEINKRKKISRMAKAAPKKAQYEIFNMIVGRNENAE